MAVRRVLVVLEGGAEAEILVCDHTQRDGVQFMDLQTVELFVADGARLDYYELEESSRETSRLSALYLGQGRTLRDCRRNNAFQRRVAQRIFLRFRGRGCLAATFME